MGDFSPKMVITLHIWDGDQKIAYSKEVEFDFDCRYPLLAMVWSPEGTELAFAWQDSCRVTEIRAWNYRTGEIRSLGIRGTRFGSIQWKGSSLLVRSEDDEMVASTNLYQVPNEEGLNRTQRITRPLLSDLLPKVLVDLSLSYQENFLWSFSDQPAALNEKGDLVAWNFMGWTEIDRVADGQRILSLEGEFQTWVSDGSLLLTTLYTHEHSQDGDQTTVIRTVASCLQFLTAEGLETLRTRPGRYYWSQLTPYIKEVKLPGSQHCQSQFGRFLQFSHGAHLNYYDPASEKIIYREPIGGRMLLYLDREIMIEKYRKSVLERKDSTEWRWRPVQPMKDSESDTETQRFFRSEKGPDVYDFVMGHGQSRFCMAHYTWS